MEIDKIRSEFQRFERRMKMVVSENQSLKRELESLKNDNKALKEMLNRKDEKLNNFQNKLYINKIVNGMEAEDDEANSMKGLIDKYIEEIDRCIAHLSQ